MEAVLLNKDFFNNLKSYMPELYSDERLDRLVTVGIFKLEEAKLEKTFDNVVVILHKLFPEKFSLISFPEYPDSIRVDNTLRLDCHHSKFVTGNRVKGYQLTSLGKISAEDTIENLKTKKPGSKTALTRLPAQRRNRATRAITSLEESDAFEKFSTKQLKQINKFDICEVLHGTLDTKLDILKQNLDTLRIYAQDLSKLSQYQKQIETVNQFLDFIESDCLKWNKEKKKLEWSVND